MILPLTSTVQRAIFVLAGLLLAGFLSFCSIRSALAAHYARLQTAEGYARAAQLEPGNARNWYLLGRFWQYNLEEPDTTRAIRAYQTALSLDPRSAETWLDLAAAYESEGDSAKARDAYLEARKAHPVSAEVSWRYGNFLLRRGELDPAFAAIRQAVQADPKRGAEAFSRCMRVEPDVEKILDRVLPLSPDVYVDILGDQTAAGQTESALKVWDRLAAMHPQLRLQDVFLLVDTLCMKRQITDAARVWNQAVAFAGLADLSGPSGSVLWDGGFESGIKDGGYAWLFPQNSRAVQINIDTQEKHSGSRSLRLTFDGESNVYFAGVCKYVPVQPSTSYRFSAWVQTRALTTDQGVRFRLAAPGASVLTTREVHGTQPWTLVELPWNSGDGVQELQVCLLRSQSYEGDGKIQGTAWVDDLALVRVPPGNATP